MGYRSEVAIAIDKKHSESFLSMLEIDPDETIQTSRGVVVTFSCIKWYEEYEYIDLIMNFLKKLDDNEYGFVRLGEDLDDVEVLGSPSEYNLGHTRIITLPLSKDKEVKIEFQG